MDKYFFRSVLGKGAFGVTYRARHKDDGPEKPDFVLKILNLKEKKDVLQRASIWMEYHFQKLVNSPNVAKVHQSHMEDNILFIEMEFANGGSLLNLIEHHLKIQKMMSFKDIWLIFIRLLKGIDSFSSVLCYFLYAILLKFKICIRKTSSTMT
jgi:serine/threonine protein kinase